MKNEFDMIGVTVLDCKIHNNRWVFERSGKLYDMAPANFTDYILSPLVIGVDKLINIGCSHKKFPKTEKVKIIFSENYFPNADVKFNLHEMKYDGWIYKIEELNLKGLMPGQSAWICPYLGIYFTKPPQSMYVKIESIN